MKEIKEKIVFGVITKIPEEHEEGNLCDRLVEAHEIRADMSFPRGQYVHFPESFVIKDQVFTLGEILVLNEYGREISGHGRKPGKWFVEYEEFKNINDAIRCAKEVMEKASKERK